MTIDKELDGFLMPDGELVSIQNVARMYAILITHHEHQAEITRLLRALAQECVTKGYCRAAYGYFEKILCLADDPGERAWCHLRMGQAMEQAGDYQAALEAYLAAFELPQGADEVWYFLNNNAGYCFNQTGRNEEAAEYCRAAIEIDPTRHNAHKNLGIALQHQGRYIDAARCFIRATRLCPADGRALAHLEDLIAGHREILIELPEIRELLQEHGVPAQGDLGALCIR